MGRAGATLLVIAAIALPSIGSAQKLYKWTDENGGVYYSDIPPDYRDRRREADQRAKDEIARHDRMLLQTYSSVADIQDLRDRRLELIESQIKLTEVYLGNLRKKLVDLQTDASNFKPYSTREDAPQIPESLSIDMSQTMAAIVRCEQMLPRMRADQAALKKSFDEDIARFIEIKGR